MVSYDPSTLISIIDDYLRLTDTCPASFGLEVANDRWLVQSIRAGIELPDLTTNAVLDRVMYDLERLLNQRGALVPVPVEAITSDQQIAEVFA
jgi:hypothetical protein